MKSNVRNLPSSIVFLLRTNCQNFNLEVSRTERSSEHISFWVVRNAYNVLGFFIFDNYRHVSLKSSGMTPVNIITCNTSILGRWVCKEKPINQGKAS